MRGFQVSRTAPPAWSQAIHDAVLPAGVELVRLFGEDEAAATARIRALGGADFYLVGDMRVGEEMLAASPQLRFIQFQGVGYDAIDVAACTRRKVPVAIAPGVTATTVAEHTLALALALGRNIVRAHMDMVQGGWGIYELRRGTFELLDKTWGVVGYGRIGQAVAQRALGFGMQVVYHDVVRHAGAAWLPLDELLRTADVVSVHVHLDASTRHLFGAAQFALMKPAAVFINCARGAVAVEADLVAALQSGRIAGAGLDVYYDEPLPPDSPLRRLPNVVLTPHIAGASPESAQRLARLCFYNVLRVQRGEPPLHVVNPEAL